MAVTPSNMLPLGTKAPDFELCDVNTGEKISLNSFEGATGLVVMFLCNHCPFVVHLAEELSEFARSYQAENVAFVAISSNDVATHPEDSPDKMKEFAERYDFDFPYLYDETQEVAKAYDAACTPDFYLFNDKWELVYRGCFDSSRPQSDIPITGNQLGMAIEALINSEPISEDQKPSVGCNIKWRS